MSALISATDLQHELLDNPKLVVLDVQYTLDGQGPALYADGHVPGAPFVDLDSVLAGPAGEGGRHPLPDVATLQAGLQTAGVMTDSVVVVYDQGPSLGAARAWWVLRWAGIEEVLVLDGGLAAWRAAGGAVDTDPVETEPGDVVLDPDQLVALDAEDAAATARLGVLVDARTPERFRGESEPIDPVAGHIPGAVNVPMADLATDDGRLRPGRELRERFAREGIDEVTVVGTYCGSGITAAHTALALHEAGVEADVYVGSWSEWITDSSRPVATGD
ncbi:sulfurtransferase [Janibacter anophelis]|uniref:sulfurtransferase n=1 Tax=Janibacter anophelis TaxID=319054 RepID=UPI0008369675|nr:sulfurtransferase [Janibacter anophelis]